MYTVPIVAFPIVASTVHVIFIVKFNSVHPTDEMNCDSSKPEWCVYILASQPLN